MSPDSAFRYDEDFAGPIGMFITLIAAKLIGFGKMLQTPYLGLGLPVYFC